MKQRWKLVASNGLSMVGMKADSHCEPKHGAGVGIRIPGGGGLEPHQVQ